MHLGNLAGLEETLTAQAAARSGIVGRPVTQLLRSYLPENPEVLI